MANASADKFKALAIRHGEKAVVGLTATIFVVFVVLAILNPVLEMNPEELKSSATSAQSNLQAKQTDSDILAKLEKDGLKEPNFQKIIEGQIVNALKPDDYRARLEWVSPEPGAGLIRDQPELIAPVELTAFPGRGGILMYSLEKGERVVVPGDPKTKTGRNGAGMAGMPGPGGSGGGDDKKKETPQEKQRREAEIARKQAAFAGKVDPAAEKKEEAEGDTTPQGPFKEETKGKRWVVITATLDNTQLKKNYLLALKNEAIAYPNFKRVDVERQTLQTDGSWSEWAATEKEKNYEVLDNLPEYDTEFVPESQRPSALVDPLPFLKAGYWAGVHVAKLVPAEVRDKSKETNNTGGNYGGIKGPGMGMGMPGADGGNNSGGRSGGAGMLGPGGKLGLGMAGGPGGGGPAGGAGGEEANFTKVDEPTVMVRSLDFTVDPDHTYRFRLRIVVVNPNWNRTDVNPGVDVETKQLFGPWSEPSPIVTVPADVVAYAQAADSSERRDDLVAFRVVRWDPDKGHTVIKTDVKGPGEMIGDYESVPMPNSEGTGPKSGLIDFNSRSIVLDTFGGRQKLPDFGVPRNQFDVPVLAMIVQPNGDVVFRSQALDRADEVRQDMETTYKQAIEDSNKVREKGSSSKLGGMGKGGKKNKGNGKMGGSSNSGGRN